MSRVASSSPSTAGKVRLAPPDHHPLLAEVGERERGRGGGWWLIPSCTIGVKSLFVFLCHKCFDIDDTSSPELLSHTCVSLSGSPTPAATSPEVTSPDSPVAPPSEGHGQEEENNTDATSEGGGIKRMGSKVIVEELAPATSNIANAMVSGGGRGEGGGRWYFFGPIF